MTSLPLGGRARFAHWGASGVLVAPAALILGVMVAAPLATLVWYTLTPDATSPAAGSLSWENISHIFSTSLYLRLLVKTLLTALIAAAATVLLAGPAAGRCRGCRRGGATSCCRSSSSPT